METWTCPDTLRDLWSGWVSRHHVALAVALAVGLFWLYGELDRCK